MADGSVTITLDGVDIEVEAGQRLIDALCDAGTDIPRFCYDRRMDPVGLCRMCLVEVEFPRGMALVPSCTSVVRDGMVVDTRSNVVTKAEEGVIEFLLINHPLDCPTCDKGGECPLQDQAFAYGPGESRYVEAKRRWEKPIPISDLILLDRERCILCALCTRFSDEVSGDPLIEFKGRGNHLQVITFPDEPYASYFSGNTVQLCPVGALTAKPYRFKARPWDLEAAESVSFVDSVQPRTSVQASAGNVVRIYGVDVGASNQGWLSDKDRFIYEHIASPERVTTPLVRDEAGFREATWDEAIRLVADRLAEYKGSEVAGLGGARSTNEDAYAFGKFLRTVVVTAHLDAQLDDGLAADFAAAVTPRATFGDIDEAATILLWGADLKEEFPVLYLRVRRAVTGLGAKLVVIHPRRTGLDDVATHKLGYRVGSGAETLAWLKSGRKKHFKGPRAALSEGPVVALVGRTGLAEDPRLAEAVAAFARDTAGAKILPLVRRGNVFGALDMGLAPDLLPGRVAVTSKEGRAALESSWGPLPIGAGKGATEILQGLSDGSIRSLLLNGADPVRDHPSPRLASDALEAAEFVVAFDMFLSDSVVHADVVLPVAGLGEVEGTATNLEGRVQKVNPIVAAPGFARPLWSILDDLAFALGADIGGGSAEIISKEIAQVAPAYADVSWFRLLPGTEGIVVPGSEGTQPLQYIPADAGLAVSNAALTLHAGRVLYDDGVMVRHSPGLAGLAPEARVYLHPADAEALTVGEGDSVVVGVDGEATLTVGIDPSLAKGTIYVPFNQRGSAALGTIGTVTITPLDSGGS
ncbi:MAG: NADH-quinone oxidoreductase subunit G [Acidimicrobiia bacterium]|nr:MAG: NADH-quinone oxidoreductase subunit G [Acidimicrobiia bacterium]